MIRKEITNFDIVQICRSGQCFRMEQTGPDTCCVTAGNRYLEVTQQGDICLFSCGEEEFEHFWRQYFDLDEDYGKFKDKISSRDHYLQAAAEFGRGIRILRQDLWEMIASFLISQQNNIVRIRRCIRNLCEAYGQRLEGEQGNVFYGFPSPESLGGLPEDALKGCNLGYRSKYVVRTARDIAEGKISLDKIRRMSYPRAREELMKLYGVGEKVADCICLFGLHQMDAFPVDTHIRQAMEKHYPKGFPKTSYRGYRGVMQQYIFYYELCGK